MSFQKNQNIIVGIFGVFALIAILFFTFVSCDHKKEFEKIAPNVITAEQVRETFDREGFAADSSLILDSRYYVVTESWADQLFSSLPRRTYSVDENDCDDFAEIARVEAKRAFNIDAKIKMPITFGEVIYKRGPASYHAINIVLVQDGTNQPKVLFYEPQTKRPVKLTIEQRVNMLHIRM